MNKSQINILVQALDACSDIVFVKDKNGIYLAHNKRFKLCLENVGVIDSDFEIIGRTDYDIFPKVVADSYRETDTIAMETESEILTREAPSLGPLCPQIIIARKRPLYDLNQIVSGVIGASHELLQFETENGPIHLSEREIACLSALFKGMTAKETGKYLDISFRTVESHIANIKLKTGLNTRAELIELVRNNNAAYLLQHLC